MTNVFALTSLIGTFAFTAGHVQDSSATDATPAATASIPAVVREVLAADLPTAAPGQELQVSAMSSSAVLASPRTSTRHPNGLD